MILNKQIFKSNNHEIAEKFKTGFSKNFHKNFLTSPQEISDHLHQFCEIFMIQRIKIIYLKSFESMSSFEI